MPQGRHTIHLTNISPNESFTHSLPLVKGYISGFGVTGTQEIQLRRIADGRTTRWPVVNGNFKCVAELELGVNLFQLEFQDDFLDLELERKLLSSPYHVLPVYIICSDHDGDFQGPEDEDCSPESARRRISVGSRLIQTVTAEKLHELELGRRTFQLASDLDPNLDCILFRSQLSAAQVYKLEPEELWEHFGRELVSSQYGRDDRKFLAFLSCTRYTGDATEPATHDEVVSRVQGHVALGGGGLAIFGTGCLHTWPERISEIVPRFCDDTKVDKLRFMDDSCYRGTLGSCFSTTLGAVCHELGHAFDLGHAKTGIMGRGFDNIRLVFTVGNQQKDANRNILTRSDAQHATVAFTRDLNVTVTVESSPRRRARQPSSRPGSVTPDTPTPKGVYFTPRHLPSNKIPVEDLTFWDKSSAVMLRYHKWFADPAIDHFDVSNDNLHFDAERRCLTSVAGLRVIELRGDDGLIVASWQFLSTWVPKQFVLPNQDELMLARSVVAQDSLGNIVKESICTGFPLIGHTSFECGGVCKGKDRDTLHVKDWSDG